MNAVAQRVSVASGGLGRPLLDDAAGLAGSGGLVDDVFELEQEIRRSARLDAGGSPVVAGQQQGVFRTGDRHVQQPALLVEATLIQLAAVCRDCVRQLLSIGDVRGVQHWHAVYALGGPVAAQ